MVQPSEARKLCSRSEWEVVGSSLYPIVETLSASDLKSRLERTRELYRNGKDLVSLKHSDSRKRTSRRKNTMFAEAVDRFRAVLKLQKNTSDMQPVSKNFDKKMVEKESIYNMDALQGRDDQELGSRKSQFLSALTDYGQQQMCKSGARGVQGHVASANRRQQGRRDTKNR